MELLHHDPTMLLYINDVFSGVYANTENIDGPFTNQYFDDAGGNLYKEVWPIKSNGSKQEEINFKNALKTNEEVSTSQRYNFF